MRKLLLSLLFALPAWAQQSGLPNDIPPLPSNLYTVPSFIGGSGSGNSSAFQNAVYVGPKCSTSNTNNCFFANFDVQYAYTVTCNNTSTTITTGANDPPFVAADVGKAIAGRSALAVGAADCPPQGTITAFTSAHTVSVSNAATASVTNGGLAWGHDDNLNSSGALSTAFQASLSVGCLYLSEGSAFFTFPPFLDQRSVSTVGKAACVKGTFDTTLTPLPAFNYANCITNSACVFNATALSNVPQYCTYQDITIYSLLWNFVGSGANNVVLNFQKCNVVNAWVWQWGTNSVGGGINFTGPVAAWSPVVFNTGVNAGIGVAGTGASSAGANQTVQLFTPYSSGDFCISVNNGASLKSFGGQYGPVQGTGGPCALNNGGNWDSYGEVFFTGTNDSVRHSGTTGYTFLHGDTVIEQNGNTLGAVDCNGNGGTIILEDTQIDGGTGLALRSVAGCNLESRGRNKILNGTFSLSGNNVSALPTEVQTGSCTTNAATVTFVQTYSFAPRVSVSVTTSGSTGAQATATNTTTATIHCNGASDAFVAMVYPNPI